MSRLRLLPVLVLFVSPSLAHAFPEMVRHNYANCTSCHVSPSGGGVLTEYGRQLSREALSTWGTEKETRFLYFVEPPEWLNLGGDFRWIQTYKNTPSFNAGSLIRMQTDFEAAVHVGKFTFDQSMGFEPSRSATGVQGGGSEFFSRRQYLMYHATDEIAVRFGKFFLQYGLNTPDHIISIKRGLGWDEGAESLNLEGSYIGESWNAYLTVDFGRPDSPHLNREKGVSAVGAKMLSDSIKVGMSYFHGWNTLTSSTDTRDVFGPWGIVGFSKQLYLLAEIDAQHDNFTPSGSPTVSAWGIVDYARLGYEFHQGIHAYLQQEYSKTNLDIDTTKMVAYTLGILFYPRPHLELHLAWQKSKAPAVSSQYNDLGWILFHFYP